MEPPGNPGGTAVELELTVENVESALYQLYFDPDMEHKNVAQKWLTQAQASAQAWHFCWALLSPDKIPEVQFFGASTLHTKISRHWSDLAAEQHESLRTQLLSHILQFSSGPKMVLTRLCVALASLALNVIPQAWSQPVADMVRAFQPHKPDPEDGSGAKASQDPHTHCLTLLELLTVLPEEFQSSRLAQARRGQLREALAGEWAVVCPLLRQLMQSQDSSSQVKEKVLKCLSSWVALDVPLGEIQELLQDCFTALSDPELFDAAVETVVNAISQPDCQRYINALLSLMPLVLGLYDQLKTAAHDGDMETSHGICRIAVALGETHSRVLLEQVDHWQEYLALVNMILFCTGIPGHYPVNETTSSLTLTFWYTLQDDILSFEEEKQSVYLQVYRPVYFQLVDVLLHKSHYPSQEEYASWSSDDKEQFRIYRVDISDTLMYVYEMLGAELLSNLYERLGRLLMDPQQSAVWQDTEALLFGFQSIAETIDVNYSDVIPGLIGLIPRINISNILLADTVMYTIEAIINDYSQSGKNCKSCKAEFNKPIHVPSLSPQLNPTNKQSIIHIVGMLASLFTTLDINRQADCLEGAASSRLPVPQSTQNPVVVVLQQVFTLIQTILSKWLHDSEVVEAVCGVFDKSVRTLLHDFGPMVPQLGEMLGEIYSAFPQASALDLARQVHLRIHRPELNITSLTSEASLKCPRDHPDIAESFMDLHAQILKRKPDLYLSEQLDVKALFYCGILSLKFPETPTVKAASQFFTEFLSRCKDMPSFGDVLQRDGKLLTETVLQAVGGESPSSLTEHFSEVLLNLSRHCPALLSQWLKETLQTPGFPCAQLTAEQKHTFSQQLLREQTNKRRVKEIVKEFALLCRGPQGSGYSDY
uniref:Importin-13 n=1 Tax=Neolamprologus brichardi TaxID=32507 RepID=A0A3Q4MFG7_NEOBR